MRIDSIVLSADRSQSAVVMSDGTKLEGVVSVAANTSVEEAGIVRATIVVLLRTVGNEPLAPQPPKSR